MNRRNFFIEMGSLAIAGIAGYFLFFREPAECQGATSAKPRLLSDVSMYEENGNTVLRRGNGEDLVVCGVNAPGGRILKALDGNRTVSEVARTAGDGSAHAEAMVAYFIAQVGMMGFLARPYYATLYENVTEQR